MDQCFEIQPLSPVIGFDAIKTHGSIIDSANLIFPDDPFVKNSLAEDLLVSDPLPYLDGNQYFPLPAIPMTWADLSVKDRKERIQKRMKKKEKPLFVNLKEARRIAGEYYNRGMEPVSGSSVQGIDAGWDVSDIPKISIDPVSLETKIFYRSSNQFAGDSKLWMHVKTKYQEILTCLLFLQDSGISAKRSSGFGRFRIKGQVCSTTFGFQGKGAYLNIAPFIPSENDIKNIDFEKSAYRISVFSGRGNYHRSLGIYRYFESGSVLWLNGEVKGTLWRLGGMRTRVLSFKGSFVRLI